MNRRRFLEMTAVAARSGLVPASFASVARAQVTSSYVPVTQNGMAVHQNAIVIDGAAPLLPSTLNRKHIDRWIEGGATAI